MAGRNTKVVRSLSRNDSSISWFPHHNSIHLELPPNVIMAHINIFSQFGMTTFFASPEELMSNYLPWDPPHSPAGPVPIRPAPAPTPGFTPSPYYPNTIMKPCVNTAQVPVPHPSTIMGSSMTLPPTAPHLPFQRSERPNSRSFCHNRKHMPVPTHQLRTPSAAYGSVAEALDYRPQPPAGPYHVKTHYGRSSTHDCNNTQAVSSTAPSLPNSSPTDRTVKTAPVNKDKQSAPEILSPDPEVTTEERPSSPSDDEDTRSLSPSQMSVASSTEENASKVVTSTARVGPTLPTLKVELKRLNTALTNFKRPHSNQSDCYIVESEPAPDSGGEPLVQESASLSPPRKLQKGNQEDE